MKKGYKECPYCANEIKGKAIKCQFCGEFLSEENKEEGKTKAGKEIKKCPFCMNEIGADITVCPFCDKQLNLDDGGEFLNKNKSKNGKEFNENDIINRDSLDENEKKYLERQTSGEKWGFFLFTGIGFLYNKRWLEFGLTFIGSYVLVWLFGDFGTLLGLIISRTVLLVSYTKKSFNHGNKRLKNLLISYREQK